MALPTLRWGIIGTGLISTWFVSDLTIKDRKDRLADHFITAIGASSVEKGNDFIQKLDLEKNTFVGSYDEVYSNPDVDAIYIGLPHSFHKEAALKAIANGKHVLVEKPACVNAKDFAELIEAAAAKKVFLMEAMWLRFRPLILELQKMILEDKVIGEVSRLFADFGLDMEFDKLPEDSRLKRNDLGAGALLDIGIYSMTYARLFLDSKLGDEHSPFEVKSIQRVQNGVDLVSSVLVSYKETGAQAIVTSSVFNKTDENFVRIEGEKGAIIIGGVAGSVPSYYKIEFKDKSPTIEKTFESVGYGFYWEADACAIDISEGRIENSKCPLSESLLVLETLDEVRRQNGLVYPQDK